MTRKCCVLILAATIVAFALRLPRLAQRPMHGDEAIHAVKFGQLLEQGVYTYDPHDYHGPTLNYLTLIPAWLASAKNLTQVNEFILRIVPVFFGASLVLLLLLISDGLGPGATVYAGFLTAVSPAMVFYSRYYIQEMLLVCFSFAVIVFGYRYARSKHISYAILAGIFAGLCHATKETSIIAFGSMALALLAVLFIQRRKDTSVKSAGQLKAIHLAAGLAAAVIVSVLFHSSFLTNPRGILDSVRAYTIYFDRAGNNTLHIHPWYYYLKMLVYYRYDKGPAWTEGLILILAVIGFVAAMTKKGVSFADIGLLRFIAFYTLIMTVAYSAVSYKTPWCLLGFLHGMILLAGAGAVVFIGLVSNKIAKVTAILFLSVAFGHLTWQSYLNNYKYYADSSNPYVYAHPTMEIFTLVDKVEYYAHANPQGHQMYIDVICPGHDYWPLPWYLRSFPHVCYSDHVAQDEPAASLIIASPAVEADLRKKFYDESIPFEQRHLYMYLFEKPPYYIWLRPGVKLLGFVRKDLWDASNQRPDTEDLIRKASEK
jgi:uncharacterized protein (TIGR03663 family)